MFLLVHREHVLLHSLWMVLGCMLAEHSMFGTNHEDRPELRAKLHDQQTEWDVALNGM